MACRKEGRREGPKIRQTACMMASPTANLNSIESSPTSIAATPDGAVPEVRTVWRVSASIRSKKRIANLPLGPGSCWQEAR
jgi:hypothetical protein